MDHIDWMFIALLCLWGVTAFNAIAIARIQKELDKHRGGDDA